MEESLSKLLNRGVTKEELEYFVNSAAVMASIPVKAYIKKALGDKEYLADHLETVTASSYATVTANDGVKWGFSLAVVPNDYQMVLTSIDLTLDEIKSLINTLRRMINTAQFQYQRYLVANVKIKQELDNKFGKDCGTLELMPNGLFAQIPGYSENRISIVAYDTSIIEGSGK